MRFAIEPVEVGALITAAALARLTGALSGMPDVRVVGAFDRAVLVEGPMDFPNRSRDQLTGFQIRRVKRLRLAGAFPGFKPHFASSR